MYLLEPWDSNKDVILLVHGINDSPKSWELFINKLDLSEQQVLLFHYPSGFSLEASAMVLANLMEELYQRGGNKNIHVIAHSMGGLIAKRFIQMHQDRGVAENIDKFISISTPWNGHKAAQLGVESAPVVVPVWRDMATNSVFLKNLEEDGLPKHIKHLLIFSYAGQKGSDEANDGTVTLSSQLSDIVQEQTYESIGVNEDHVSILQSDKVAIKINRFLDL